MNKNDQIQILKDALAPLEPTFLEIEDDSGKHAGHGGWREGVVTHIHVRIQSPLLVDKNRVEQHRMVASLVMKAADFLHSVRLTIMSCKS